MKKLFSHLKLIMKNHKINPKCHESPEITTSLDIIICLFTTS